MKALDFNIEAQQLALPPNMALQQTIDPATFFAAAKNASASIAAGLGR